MDFPWGKPLGEVERQNLSICPRERREKIIKTIIALVG
jgi:hypothetical protein